jgi:hypothetical protein
MTPSDFQVNDIVSVKRDGGGTSPVSFISWVLGVNTRTLSSIVYLAHGYNGQLMLPQGIGHSLDISDVTIIHRPADEAARDLYLALLPPHAQHHHI